MNKIKKLIALLLVVITLFTCVPLSPALAADNTPTTPTSIKVTETTDTSVSLSWSQSEGATGYLVYLYNTGTKKWTYLSAVNATQAKITNLKTNSIHIFAVRAYNNSTGKSVLSETYISTKAVTGLNTPKAVTTSNNTVSSIILKWDKVSVATGYRVFVYNSTTKKWDTKIKTTGSKNYALVSNLKSGTNYIFAVRPYYNTGTQILWSKTYTKVVGTTLPDQVKQVVITGTSDTTATISWKAVNGANGYYVFSYNTATKKYTNLGGTTSTSFELKNLNTAKYNYFVVRAMKIYGGQIYWGQTSSFARSPLTVYRNFLKNNSKYIYFITLDINKDGVFELVAQEKNNFKTQIFTYKNNAVTNIGYIECSENEILYNSTLKAIGSVIFGVNMHSYLLYDISTGKVNEIAYCSVALGYNPVTYEDKTTYRIDSTSNEVSKTNYEKYYNTYFKNTKSYTLNQNTENNRNEYL